MTPLARTALCTLTTAASLLTLSACGAGDDNPEVVNETFVLADDAERSYTLREGSFQIDIGSDVHGVRVSWIGLSCASAAETKNYSARCTIPGSATLLVLNPSGTNSTGAETVKVHVVRQ